MDPILQPFAVASETLDWYRRYVRAGFPLRDAALDDQRERLIDEGLLWREPFVALARPGTTGPKLEAMRGTLADATLGAPWGFEQLYDHQARAIERLAISRDGGPEPTLVLSGTGSGKTESFLIPIVDACLRDSSPGIKAVILYPMNALANDQLKRLRGLLEDFPDVTFGRYTGDAPETDGGDGRRPGRPDDVPANLRWSRQAMRDEPPNILLTNYTMLEYLLLRRKDDELFQHGAPKYFVVDEIHLFGGVLGAEVASLVRRFRQHVGGDDEICMVGTSATAGTEEQDRLLTFASRFFGVEFNSAAAIAETSAPFEDVGALVPPAPEITNAMLGAAHDAAGLAALAKATFGLDLPGDEAFGDALGKVIDRYATVSVVERSLDRPASLDVAGHALGELPEREGCDRSALTREAQAIVLLGAEARRTGVGEGGAQPRFRPRVHQVLRSLAGLWRCADPDHGVLAPPDGSRCSCGSITLPVATCRTCGEAYWTSRAPSDDLAAITRLQGVDPERGEPVVFLADRTSLPNPVDEDEDGNKVRWEAAEVCPACGAFAASGSTFEHHRSCPSPGVAIATVLASTDDVHCPLCGDLGARNRPILLPLKGSAAATVAVITQGLSDVLRERTTDAGGRLLVFSDSRQNAAQQAGYSDDQGARIAIRQLLTTALATGGALTLKGSRGAVHPLVLDDDDALRRWLVGEATNDFAQVSEAEYVPSPNEKKDLERQLDWEVALEVTERARRRFSLEREGVITVTIDDLDVVVAAVAAAWPAHPFADDVALRETVVAVFDVLRYGRAVSHWLLKLSPGSVASNHGVRVGDQAVQQTRGYGAKKYSNRKDGIDIRAWTAPKHVTRLTELVGRVLQRPPTEVNEVVEALVSRLGGVGLLVESKAGGRKRSMLDEGRVLLQLRDGQPLWRCNRCGAVRSSALHDISGRLLCANWRCSGIPEPFEPVSERAFYRDQYLSTPRRFIVREHSGQTELETRLALEAAFNDRERSLVDALACTPTLEVGVSLDDLNSVILRNLPPSPANYAQRVGRAGRRSKVALAIAHAGQGPHDSYYFEQPGELIAGDVRAPAISLDNEPLLRRHINSLVIEVIGLDLPARWVPQPDGDASEATVADADGVLRETAVAPIEAALADPELRGKVESAALGAFAAPNDPAPPANAVAVCRDQVEHFTSDLRVALNRWCDRYRALVEEFKRAQRAPGIPSPAEKDEQDRLYREIQRLAAPSSPEYQPLGFLGLVGFLPRYGFTGESVLLHAGGSDEPIVQSAPVAVTEFAPGNIVFARGRKLKVRRIEPKPVLEADGGIDHRDNVLSSARRCDACEYLTRDPLEKSCPTCSRDLVSQWVLTLTSVYGSGGAISSEDEYRRRGHYDLRHVLGPSLDPPEETVIGGITFVRSHGRSITVANAGVGASDGHLHGFDVCTWCGFAEEASEKDDQRDPNEESPGHRAACPARKDPASVVVKRNVWLTAQMQGDALELVLPLATRDEGFVSWRVSLAEALMLGIRETMQAGRRDLDWFERRDDEAPVAIALFDTMPGGTGYIPNLFAGGATGLKLAALEAAERLAACTCTSSCHRCLRDFWNQRYHDVLNRFEVIGVLRRLAGAAAVDGVEAEDERLESFLEQQFFDRLTAAGLPTPTLQVYRDLGSGRITVVDCEYRDPNVSIFLDGRAFHAQSVEKIEADVDRRNRLEHVGVCVLEFTYADVMEHFDVVAKAIRQALAGGSKGVDVDVDTGSLPGLRVLDVDSANKRIDAEVDAASWVRSESSRQASLNSANRARLAGWRLQRRVRR